MATSSDAVLRGHPMEVLPPDLYGPFMSYRIEALDDVEDGVRRIAREQIRPDRPHGKRGHHDAPTRLTGLRGATPRIKTYDARHTTWGED